MASARVKLAQYLIPAAFLLLLLYAASPPSTEPTRLAVRQRSQPYTAAAAFPAPAPVPATPLPTTTPVSVPQCEQGTCFLGQCFCDPGFDGDFCRTPWSQPPPGSCVLGISDACAYHPKYGVAKVSEERWAFSRSDEQKIWATNGDHNEGHAVSFDNYQALPEDLGDLIEVGCGPFTHTKTILDKRRVLVKSITLLDPNVVFYTHSVKQCEYKNGQLRGLPTVLINAGAEILSKSPAAYDTLVMIDVIAHVQNAFDVLTHAYNTLKPGGILVWHERLWDNYNPTPNNPSQDREFRLRPIRLKKALGQFFASRFETLLYRDETQSAELQRLGNQGIYFIGRKPASSFVATCSVRETQRAASLPVPETAPAPPAADLLASALDALDAHLVSALRLPDLNALQAKLYGHIYNAQNLKQATYYQQVVSNDWAQIICEVGFAGGHSSAVYLTANPNARLYSFDDAGKPDVVDAASTFLRSRFPGRFTLTRGDSTVTVPQFGRSNPDVKCDIISIDGAHHAHFPQADTASFCRLAAERNLVLLDDSNEDWPAVQGAIRKASNAGYLEVIEDVNSDVVFRGKRKAWTLARYLPARCP